MESAGAELRGSADRKGGFRARADSFSERRGGSFDAERAVEKRACGTSMCSIWPNFMAQQSDRDPVGAQVASEWKQLSFLPSEDVPGQGSRSGPGKNFSGWRLTVPLEDNRGGLRSSKAEKKYCL